jgi:hypothetical protein
MNGKTSTGWNEKKRKRRNEKNCKEEKKRQGDGTRQKAL